MALARHHNLQKFIPSFIGRKLNYRNLTVNFDGQWQCVLHAR